MKILVAGGAGFIGSHLCRELLNQGHKVICVDNLKTGKRKNLSDLVKNKNFKFVLQDIRNPLKISSDYIFNLASYASPPYYQKWSIETMLSNSLGSYQLLELARKQKAGYLLASTSEVYGDPLHHPQVETDWGNVNPVGVRACYDESKRFAEALTMEYLRRYNLNVRIIRIFNTYGPGLQPDDGRIVSNFIKQALNGKTLTIYGTGRQTRSFCYIEDLIAGIIKAAFKNKTKGEIFNLGNPKEFTVLEVAQMIQELMGKSLKLVKKPLPKDDPQKRKPNINKAKKRLAWQPQIALEQGLLKTIAWYKRS